MRTTRGILAIPLLLAASAASALGFDVRDKAGLFSADAVKKANDELARVERETSIPVTIETTTSLNGEAIGQAIPKYARRENVRGLFVLIARDEGKVDAEASREYQRYFNRPRFQSIYEAFLPGFKARDFDAGLAAGVSSIGRTLVSAKAETPAENRAAAVRRPANAPAMPPAHARSGFSSLIGIGLLVLAVLIGFRIISALFNSGRGAGYGGPGYGGPMRGPGPGGPGYGGPGYGGGGGGGGFMSSLFGGIGGAMAGNWLYDQFGNRHRGGYEQGGVAPGADPGTPADAGPEWSGANDGGGDFGGGGGDWGGGGGGGGGDWGGGGGGGDWGGGGGGGDWGGGGGGGDGGSW